MALELPQGSNADVVVVEVAVGDEHASRGEAPNSQGITTINSLMATRICQGLIGI